MEDATDEALPAGQLSDWLIGIEQALAGEADARVPCDGCTACCTSSQFVHIAADEKDTLAHVPDELLFPAPGKPGTVLLGYDDRGHCPMLVDDACTIYDHRPRTCRTYDCRVFAAAGVDVGGEKPLVAAVVRTWQFSYADEGVRAAHDEIRAAAPELGPGGAVQVAIERRHIRAGFGSSTPTAAGVLTTIELTIVGATPGAPLEGAAVYLWHCDQQGRYSLYSNGVTNENYLRGVQAAGADGTVTFTTVF